ncbi:related to `extra sex combs` protein (WD-40 repeat family protein) [Rhynchosporium graminicola]|uniref:Related to `extra sex combs` protein (WD-40 repeat family protein) n=1 Tax=Rhynchosporium graminicola TaxID=2792576 RepID=A0A1E1KR29_9HELO|nr:related to `extra sex combs` protein (WD-40 repeat family protein) [Rhynchosporium commune]
MGAPPLERSSSDAVSADFWSVKFYPYTEPGVDPVFAVVGGKRILVCRPPSGKDNTSIEVIQEILDEEDDIEHYACAWSRDVETGLPLLCVAGLSAQIKVFNVITGDLLKTLSGHGAEINDLAVSPVNPCLVASASEDCTVRIWSLDPRHESQPCAAILEGDSHVSAVLSLAFHSNGRYLLSAGQDHRMNLWALPEFPDINTGTNKVTRIYYPHFSVSEIHSDIVDCIAWYGDLILSKSDKEEVIVLWSITNFNSSLPPLPQSSAPTTHDTSRDARSAFVTPPPSLIDNAISLYTRHLQFSIPESNIMFTRFSLYPGNKNSELSHNPVLAFCNTNSKVFFFDLARLENYWEVAQTFEDTPKLGGNEPPTSSDGKPLLIPTEQNPRAHPFLHPFQRRNRGGGSVSVSALGRLARETSLTESTNSDQTNQDETSQVQPKSARKIDWGRTREGWKKKYSMEDPSKSLDAHHAEMVRPLKFTGRQVAWSGDGMWCVVVGSEGSIGILGRWK